MMKSPVASVLLALAALFAAQSISAESLPVPRSGVAIDDAVADGVTVAAMNPAWEVMIGAGKSMAPHYGEGSVLVVDRMPFEQLRPGMMVVFQDRDGDWVGHWLVSRDESGWRTQGANNGSMDPDTLTPERYRGVIFGVLNASDPGPGARNVAAQAGLPVVLGKSR